jgi:hypothetical protein
MLRPYRTLKRIAAAMSRDMHAARQNLPTSHAMSQNLCLAGVMSHPRLAAILDAFCISLSTESINSFCENGMN